MADRKYDIEDLPEEDQESIEMLREIFVQFGFSLVASWRCATKMSDASKERVNSEWMKLADMVVEFALDH